MLLYLRVASCLLLLIPLVGASQSNLCSGNLGDNIFEDGDFGRGTANIPATDPNIAPGYIYTRNPPPEDGFYTITNNTARWSGIYESWLRIPDQSSDASGYMMVVNASFAPGVFYEETISGLCENTVYEFSADIINMIRIGVPDHIEPNVSFFLDGEQQFSTGDIPQNERWQTYGFTFTTPPGVTEMTLTLRNNAPGGIGNDLALDNISFRACGPSAFIDTEENIFLCADANEPEPLTADIDRDEAFVQWQRSLDQGETWENIPGATESQYFHSEFAVGIYQYRYLSAGSPVDLTNFKCRIISDIITIEVLPEFYEAIDTVCEGVPYSLGNQLLTESGTYTATLISSRGCDSVVTVNLTVLENRMQVAFDAQPPACLGEQNGRIEIGPVTDANPPFTYFLDGQASNNPLFSDLPEGAFQLQVTDRFGCTAADSATLSIDRPFSVEAGPALLLDFGQESDPISLLANDPIRSVRWEPSVGLSCADCPDPVIVGLSDIAYLIRAESEAGCFAVDTLLVAIGNRIPRIYIPNAFSPNGDGINDVFQLFTTGRTISVIHSFRVFNRWGGLVYEFIGPVDTWETVRWDGQAGGEIAEAGPYIYQFDLELVDGRRVAEAGTVVLMR